MRHAHRLLIALCATASLALAGCKTETNDERAAKAREAARDRVHQNAVRAACASGATTARLKQIVFDQAIRIPGANAVNLDRLSSYSTVRMEQPTVKSRDEALDVTVCTGDFILQLPPGAERAFDGDRALTADIEYAAQAAADGSGLVYRIKGAEDLVARLATFDPRGITYRAPVAAETVDAVEATPPPPPPPPPPAPTPRATRTAPVSPATAAAARTLPSFDCRRARTRSEHMVCGSDGLAALDRTMSSQFYSALSNGDAATRAELRRTRDRFLAYRERCPDEACVAQAYRDRMDEIRDIGGR